MITWCSGVSVLERVGYRQIVKPSSRTSTGGTDHMSNNRNTKEEPASSTQGRMG